MSFQEADHEYAELKRRYDDGEIGPEEFDSRRERLMVADNEGRWWAKARETGDWMYYNGDTWARGIPAGYKPPPRSLPADSATDTHPSSGGATPSSNGPVRDERPPLPPRAGPAYNPPTRGQSEGERRRGTPRWLLVAAPVAALVILLGLVAVYFIANRPPPDPVAQKESSPAPSRSADEVSSSPVASGSGSTGTSQQSSEEGLRAAVEDYYEAVDREDWDYTYENLDSQTQQRFTRDEWVSKNEYLATNYPLRSSTPTINSPASSSVVEVTLAQSFTNGTSQSRITYFVYEDGLFKHRLSQEELDLFLADVSFEEFARSR